MPKKLSDEDYLLEAVNAHNRNAKINLIKTLKDNQEKAKLQDYAREKYIIPNNLKGTEIVKKFIVLKNNGTITTTKQIDDFFSQNEKSGKSKKELISDIGKTIKDMESVKIKKAKKSTAIPQMLEVAEMIVKAPKTKKIEYNKEIDDSIAEIDKLLKATKPEIKKLVEADKEHLKYHPSEQDKKEYKLDKKIMKHAEGYEHKVVDASPAVKQYVEEFKYILLNFKTPSVITKKINELKADAYEKLKPSDIDDANKLIRDFRKSLPPPPTKEKKVKAKKEKVEKPVDNSYKGDKKYKPYTAYIKKHKPHFSDPEDIHLVVMELIDKKVPRMSVKILEKAMEDAGYDEKDIKGSGYHNHYDDSDTSSGSSSDYE